MSVIYDVSISKEMYDALVDYVGTEDIRAISKAIVRIIQEEDPMTAPLVPKKFGDTIDIRLRIPKAKYAELKDVAERRKTYVSLIVRGMLARRLGLKVEETQRKANWGVRMIEVSFKLPAELLQALDVYAANHKLSRSDVIREAIEYYLNSHSPTKETRDNSKLS